MILRSASIDMVLLKPLLKFDHWLFNKINREWINPFFDVLLPFARQPELWYPLYLFLGVFVMYNFRLKGSWWIITLIMTAIISDLASSSLLKSLIFRYRPCQNPDTMDQVRLLVNYCPQNSSFVSSAACNHFAAAWFIFITLNQTGSWRWLLFPWALMVSYAQVYTGVHYPLDIISGAILGIAIGYGMSKFFRLQFGSLPLK